MKATLLLMLALAVSCQATAITSAQSGNWNSAGTWVGGSIPVSGDTVTIATGHAVTLPTGYTATSDGVTCSGTGSLVVSGGLSYLGNVSCGNMTVNAGAHVQAGGAYNFVMPSSCTPSTCVWSLDGTASAISWDVSSGAAGYIDAHNGTFTATGVNWTNLGSASQYSFQTTLHSAGATFSIHNSTCTNCGQVAEWERANGTTFSLDNFRLISAAATNANAIALTMANGYTSGTFEIVNSYVGPGAINLNCTSFIDPGLVLRGNFFYNEFANVTYGATPCNLPGNQWDTNALWTNNTTSSVGSLLPAGYLRTTYLLSSVQDTCTNENYHTTTFATEDTTLDGWILEGDCGKERPNTFGGKPTELGSTPGTHAYSIRMTNNIQLPRTAGLGGAAGDGTMGVADSLFWVAMACNGTTTFCGVLTIDHNTTYASDVGVLYTTEVSNTQVTVVAAAKDNIIWRNTSGASGKIGLTGHTLPDGSVLGAQNNWKYNDNGTGVQYDGSSSYYSPAAGMGDTIGDPQFVDSTRNFIKWCQTIDPALTTWAGCRDKFKDVDARANGYTVEKLMEWVRAGFVPYNEATATASSTGGQVGARDFVRGSTGVAFRGSMRMQ